jgi:hypothetical protein
MEAKIYLKRPSLTRARVHPPVKRMNSLERHTDNPLPANPSWLAGFEPGNTGPFVDVSRGRESALGVLGAAALVGRAAQE